MLVFLAHLVGNHDRNIKLFRELEEAGQHLVELLLAVGKLAAARIIDAKEGNDRVDYL